MISVVVYIFVKLCPLWSRKSILALVLRFFCFLLEPPVRGTDMKTSSWVRDLPADVRVTLRSLETTMHPDVVLSRPPQRGSSVTQPSPAVHSSLDAIERGGPLLQQLLRALNRVDTLEKQQQHLSEERSGLFSIAALLPVLQSQATQKRDFAASILAMTQDARMCVQQLFRQSAKERVDAEQVMKRQEALTEELRNSRDQLQRRCANHEATIADLEAKLIDTEAKLEQQRLSQQKLTAEMTEKLTLRSKLAESEAERRRWKRQCHALQTHNDAVRQEVASLTQRHKDLVEELAQRAAASASSIDPFRPMPTVPPTTDSASALLEQIRAMTIAAEQSKVSSATLLEDSKRSVATLSSRVEVLQQTVRDKEVLIERLNRQLEQNKSLARELGLCRGRLVAAEKRAEELSAVRRPGSLVTHSMHGCILFESPGAAPSTNNTSVASTVDTTTTTADHSRSTLANR